MERRATSTIKEAALRATCRTIADLGLTLLTIAIEAGPRSIPVSAFAPVPRRSTRSCAFPGNAPHEGHFDEEGEEQGWPTGYCRHPRRIDLIPLRWFRLARWPDRMDRSALLR